MAIDQILYNYGMFFALNMPKLFINGMEVSNDEMSKMSMDSDKTDRTENSQTEVG